MSHHDSTGPNTPQEPLEGTGTMANTDRIERIAQDIWTNRAADLADGDEQFIAYYVADEAGHLYNGEFEAIVTRIVELSNARRNS